MLNARTIRLLTLSCLTLYLVFGLAWISLPGPQHDEVIFLNASLPADLHPRVLHYIQIFNWDIPAMLLSYVGALKGWLWWLIFQVWAPSIYSVRVPAVLLGGLGLWLFYRWARMWYSQEVALLALALTATDASYIFTSRLDWGPVVLQHLLIAAGLLLGTKWYHSLPGAGSETAAPDANATPAYARPRTGMLFASGFCFGLALWDKATAVWFCAALAVTLFALFPRDTWRALRPKAMALFLFAMLLGAFRLVHYNLHMKGSGTAERLQLDPLTPAIFQQKVGEVKMAFNGTSVQGLVAGYREPYFAERYPGPSTTLLNAASVFSLLFRNFSYHFFLLGLLAVPLLRGARRAILFPYLISLLMWLQMIIAKDGGYSIHHLALIYPFPQLALAAVAGRVWQTRKRWAQWLVAFAVVSVLAVQISRDARNLRLFRETGGERFWSSAAYELSADLRREQPDTVVVMDWGISNLLLLLNPGEFQVMEMLQAQDPDYLRAQFANPRALFIVHGESLAVFTGGKKLVREIAPQSGATCATLRTYRQTDNAEVFRLLRCTTGVAPSAGSTPNSTN